MRVGVLTLLWKRRALSEIVLDFYNNLSTPGVDLVKVAVSSKEDPRRLDRFDGWTILEAANRPLSGKWNLGCRFLRNMDVDGVVVIGSDDVLSRNYFKVLRTLSHDVDYLVPSGIYICNVQTLECIYISKVRVGAGRFMRSSLLDKVAWKPWPDNVNAFLDSSMDKRLRGHVARRSSFDPIEKRVVIVDIKTGHNIWSFGTLKSRVRHRNVALKNWNFTGREDLFIRLRQLRSKKMGVQGKR